MLESLLAWLGAVLLSFIPLDALPRRKFTARPIMRSAIFSQPPKARSEFFSSRS